MAKRPIAGILVALLVLCGTGAWAGVTPFTETYLGSGSGADCDTLYPISGMEPDDGAPHPIFVYLVGTTETYNNAQAMAAVKGMAAKGFVAATVHYRNHAFGTCADIAKKAACMFKPESAESAVSKLCARGDCSKGIVLGGFSQGAVASILAKNTEPRVKAVFGMGALSTYGTFNLASCMNNGKHKLPGLNLRVVNGEADFFAGGLASKVRTSSIAVTGKRCGSTAFSCLNANGSGWILVRNAQVKDRAADHCYQRATKGCFGNQNLLDANWKASTATWALPANLNWLKKFARP